MRQVDIERFEKIEKLLPGVLGETEDILIEIEYDKETVYPAIKCQLMEIKRIVDNRIIPTDEEKERIRVGYLIEREFDGAGELPEYGKLVAEIGYIYDALGDPPEFKYFTLPKEKATYVDIPCECCGTAGY